MNKYIFPTAVIAVTLASTVSAQTIDSQKPGSTIESTPTNGCEMRVFTANSVAGLTKKSGFAKFALGTVLPSIAGSVAGSGSGGRGFEAGRNLGNQSSIAANRLVRDKASDVPAVIYDELTPERQAIVFGGIVNSRAALLNSATPSFDDGDFPTKEAVATRFNTTGQQCLRIAQITGITFEHSKDFKSRNAIVVSSLMYEYQKGKAKPIITVVDETRTAINEFPLKDENSTDPLKKEVSKALESAVNKLLNTFEKKRT